MSGWDFKVDICDPFYFFKVVDNFLYIKKNKQAQAGWENVMQIYKTLLF